MAWKKKNKKHSDEVDLSLEGAQVPEMPTVGEVLDSIESADAEPVDTGIKFTDPSEVVEVPQAPIDEPTFVGYNEPVESEEGTEPVKACTDVEPEPVKVQEVKPVVQPKPQVVQKPKVAVTKSLNDGWKKFFPGLK